MFKYLSDLFSSLLNMSVFMNDDSYKSNTSVEVEEKEIRNNLNKRTSDLLKKVFALQDRQSLKQL